MAPRGRRRLPPRRRSQHAGSASPTAARIGSWSAPFDVGTIGTHASLLRNGDVLLFIYPLGDGFHSSSASLFDPVRGKVADSTSPARRNLFCSGHSLLPDGRLLVTGGTMWGMGHFYGTDETDLYDSASGTWAKGPKMAHPRWYPTNVTLPGGDVLIVSGEAEGYDPVQEVERYAVATNTLSELPPTATRLIHDYPRMLLLPSGKVFLAGQERDTALLDPETATWSAVGPMVEPGRYEGNAVLLPGLSKVLAIGGNDLDPLEPTSSHGLPTSSAEIIDFAQPSPVWRATAPMHFARQHQNAVLLPDGSVLVVGGGQRSLYDAPVRAAELFDPATETWKVMASQRWARCYHSTALLLPDGRVLSAGMDHGKGAHTAEIYSPPYLFRGPRPVIEGVSRSVAYGSSFTVTTAQAADIRTVTLLRPASVTHADNFEQRYVALTFEAADGQLTAHAPAGGAEAPPGWYMLFVVGGSGVPSTASWVHLG